jgi:hypothetical protein
MANSISGQGSNLATINGFPYTLNFQTQTAPIGSGSFVESVQINTGGWQAIYTSSTITDCGTVYVRNPGPGTVQLAVSSSGGGMLGTYTPNEWSNQSWSSSIQIYGRALDSASYVNIALLSN